MKEVRLAYKEDLIQATMNYLSSRPFAEVAGLIGGFQSQAVKVEIEVQTEEKE